MSSPLRTGSANEACAGIRDLRWLLTRLVDEAPGIRSVAVVSSDGLPLLSSVVSGPAGPPSLPEELPAGPEGASADLSTVVSGIAGLTTGAAALMDAGRVEQVLVAMETGSLVVMAISDGSLLGVHTAPVADLAIVTYHMARFVGRAGHLLTPQLRAALQQDGPEVRG
ncbi:roadblock/LC7 domain-containing protein [Streptomyces sp. ACA25]|uniref:roadblock/LC7 domain-containing protein n=1 Tax=Streptomyces sp. ACA25 TaxID=3022596 RepID=UPI002307AB1B|nr:roadblock/LC7 domain-containing protein [Streptomyces sp. ACA25]MDB1087575.1 roadblock/LC7 domain-containing protein [Streptomyces sp. ACA25]